MWHSVLQILPRATCSNAFSIYRLDRCCPSIMHFHFVCLDASFNVTCLHLLYRNIDKGSCENLSEYLMDAFLLSHCTVFLVCDVMRVSGKVLIVQSSITGKFLCNAISNYHDCYMNATLLHRRPVRSNTVPASRSHHIHNKNNTISYGICNSSTIQNAAICQVWCFMILTHLKCQKVLLFLYTYFCRPPYMI